MTSKTLTNNACKNAKPAESGKRKHLWDSQVPGFGLRITDRGARSFIWLGRVRGHRGSTIRVTIGKYVEPGNEGGNAEDEAQTGSLAWAREMAREIHRMASRGIDPRREMERQRQIEARQRADTFRAVAEAFNKRHLATLRSGSERWSAIERILLPKWGAIPIREITRADVFTVLDELEDAGTPYARNRRLADIRKIFNFALERGSVDANPAARIGLLRETRRERVLNDEELRAVWGAFDMQPEPWRQFFQMLLLTGQRRTEVASIEKSELDFRTKLWTIPAEKAKNGIPHTVPLTSASIDVLKSLSKWDGDFIFTTTAGRRPISGYGKRKAKVDKGCGIEDWRLHDLRRTAATRMSALSVDRFIVGKVLNHVDRAVTGVYDRHSYDQQKRRALNRWAAELHRILADDQESTVVPLRRGKKK